MQESLLKKLESLLERFEELAVLMSEPDVISNQAQFKAYAKEYAKLEPVAQNFKAYQSHQTEMAELKAMMDEETDPELQSMAKMEFTQASSELETLSQTLQIQLLPEDTNDNRNIYLEIRAGTGGDEAAIFSGDLFRMYSRYFERQGWQTEVITANEGEHGGFKEIIARVIGQGVYRRLKFESGAHRVQRVPETESQGRIHTSACTVAILPEVEEVDAIDVNPDELRIDTFRASGAGGQHVNKTDSAIRITHLPTGTVVECQDERSQHKNKAKALALLKTRLLNQEQEKQQKEQADARKSLVGSGDRSERIRTYNYPQGRVTDHRINLTLYKLPEIMEGALSSVIDPLLTEYQAEQLKALSQHDA